MVDEEGSAGSEVRQPRAQNGNMPRQHRQAGSHQQARSPFPNTHRLWLPQGPFTNSIVQWPRGVQLQLQQNNLGGNKPSHTDCQWAACNTFVHTAHPAWLPALTRLPYTCHTYNTVSPHASPCVSSSALAVQQVTSGGRPNLLTATTARHRTICTRHSWQQHSMAPWTDPLGAVHTHEVVHQLAISYLLHACAHARSNNEHHISLVILEGLGRLGQCRHTRPPQSMLL